MTSPSRLGALCYGVLFCCLQQQASAELRFHPELIELGELPSGSHQVQSWLVNLGDSAQSDPDVYVLGSRMWAEPVETTIEAGDSLLITVNLELGSDLPLEEVLLVSSVDGLGWASLEVRATPYHEDWPGAAGLWGEDLLDYLAAEVAGHTVFSYSGARQQMFGNYDNVDGQVQCVYTGTWITTSGIPDGSVMNCEHTWPQSMGAEGDARSDMHHLFPTLSTPNSVRGNLPFGDVVSQNWSQGGSLRGTDANGVTVFEPRDIHKGDCARAVFYFALRYSNREDFLTYQEQTLRGWAVADPVSQKEIDRNNDIDDLQHNRNPFVDHNDFLDRIAGLSVNPDPATTRLLQIPPDTLRLGSADIGDTLLLRIPLLNTGNQSLLIGYVQSMDPALSVLSSPALVPSLQTEWVELAWHPQEAGGLNSVLRISSNSQNGALQELPFTGYGDPSTSLDPAVVLPREWTLGNAWPNPFNPVTQLSLAGSLPAELELQVHDIAGRCVVSRHVAFAGGTRQLRIDLENQASGIYFLTLQGEQHSEVRKLTLLR